MVTRETTRSWEHIYSFPPSLALSHQCAKTERREVKINKTQLLLCYFYFLYFSSRQLFHNEFKSGESGCYLILNVGLLREKK